MIRLKSEYKVQTIPNMKGGEGEFVIEHILKEEELHGKGRLYGKGTLKPGCTVGNHYHEGDVEICYFLSGTGLVRDENGERPVGAGDCNICEDGKFHEIINIGESNLEYMVLILFIK
jgi:quercetin dioxygenase-like cupin family protein